MSFYLIIFVISGLAIRGKYNHHKPYYNYYLPGLLASIAGAIAVCLIYLLYYGGGDTTDYHRGALSMVRLLHKDPGEYFKLLIGIVTPESRYVFDSSTGVPWQITDYFTFTVVRLSSIFVFFGFNNYFTASLLIGWIGFMGKWSLYKMFCELYPGYYKSFAIMILFLPSLVFWGSGMLKDTYTLAASGWFMYNFYRVFIKKQYGFVQIFMMVLGAFLIATIKPYVFVAITPGVVIWLSFDKIKRIENPVGRIAVAPAVLLFFIGIGLLVLNLFSSYLGEYGSIDSIIRKAMITQDDMMRAHAYSENFFDIGRLDGTLWNFLSKIPAATMAGLFRPYLWDVRNPLMLLSALENAFLLGSFLLVLWRVGLVKGAQITFNEPVVIFSLIFALIFAFGVGVSTANFGALVRLRIPLLPYLASALMILLHKSIELKKEKEATQRQPFVVQKYF